MTVFSKLGCPNCSLLKPKSAHTYAAYYVYMNDSVIKVICKGCRHVQRYRYIQGGITGRESDDENDKTD